MVIIHAKKGKGRKLLEEFTGIDLRRKLRTLSEGEFERLLDAMQRIEGWEVGEEKIVKPETILDVRRGKNNRIFFYLISNMGWVGKEKTVELILEGLVDAVVASRGGKTHVRTLPDGSVENNIEN